MSPISLFTSVSGIEASFSPPASARIELAIDASGRTVRRTTNSAAKIPIRTPAVPSTMLCHLASASVPREVVRQHPAPPRADFAQQFGDAPDQPALGAQHFLVELGDLGFGPRNRRDRVGVGVGRGAQRGSSIGSARMLCAARSAASGSCASSAAATWFCARNRLLAVARSAIAEIAVSNRSRTGGKRRDQFRAARDQGGDALDALAVVLQPRR